MLNRKSTTQENFDKTMDAVNVNNMQSKIFRRIVNTSEQKEKDSFCVKKMKKLFEWFFDHNDF